MDALGLSLALTSSSGLKPFASFPFYVAGSSGNISINTGSFIYGIVFLNAIYNSAENSSSVNIEFLITPSMQPMSLYSQKYNSTSGNINGLMVCGSIYSSTTSIVITTNATSNKINGNVTVFK